MSRLLSAYIEERSGVRVRIDQSGGCGPATEFECELWDALEAAERDAWLPIETAPKDGSFILAVVSGFVPAVAQWTTDFRQEGEFAFQEPGMFAEESHWQAMLEQTDPWQPTHWRPLPAPPKKED